MPLQLQTLEMPLIKGVDQKTDSKQVQFGKLLVAENTTFQKVGKIQKRNGFQAISRSKLESGQITDGQALMNFKNELICFDQQNIYSYVEGTNEWKDKGDFESIYLTSKAITNGTSEDYGADSAVHNSGIECYVWLRNEGGASSAYYQVQDGITGQLILGPVTIKQNDVADVKVAAFGDTFVIVYRDTATNQLFKGVLPVNNLATTVTYAAITDISANLQSLNNSYLGYTIGTITSGSTEYLYTAWNSRTSPVEVVVNRYDTPTSTSPSATTASSNRILQQGHFFYNGADNTLGLVYTPNKGFTTQLGRLYEWSIDLSTAVSAQDLPVPANANNPQRITAVQKGTAGRNIQVFLDYTNQSTNIIYTRGYQVAGVNGSGVNLTFDRQQIGIAGTCFVYGDKAYCPVVGGAAIQAGSKTTYFLIDTLGFANARYLNDLADSVNVKVISSFFNYVWVPRTNVLSNTEFCFATRNITSFGDISGQEQTGITKIKFDFFEPEKSYSRSEIAQSLYVGGGMLYQYDGQNLVEDSFNWLPYISTATSTAQASNGSQVYSYVATWEWVDNQGNLHRSAPSDPKTIKLTGSIGAISAGSASVNLELAPLSLTQKNQINGRSPVVCVLYRTKANGDVYYKLPVGNGNKNDIYATKIQPSADQIPDTSLTEPIYTTGDVLGNDIPPPVGSVVVHRNRLFLLDSTNPLQIWYSKAVAPAIPVEWSNFNVINVDPSGGPVTGLASLDDKLIIFKESQIRFVAGQGPDNTGANNDFSDSILITTDAGCTNLRSIVNTPEGLIFKSSKGIYLLNRGMQVSYIGAPVEDFNSAFVTSAVLMAKNNQIRLTLDVNKALVYDYYVDAWSVFTNVAAVDSIIWNATQAYIRDNGQVMVETPNTYKDNGSSYNMKISTTWLNFQGIQGFQRLWDFLILGEFRSSHRLQIQLYYDFNDSPSQTIIVDPVVPNYYGTQSPYGLPSGSVYGGTFDLYQYRVNPARQKCMNMKAVIQDIPLSGSLDEGMQISNLRFEYGIEGGSNRLRTRQQAG